MDGDGRITFADFLAFYSTLATSSACQELRSAFGPQAERALLPAEQLISIPNCLS